MTSILIILFTDFVSEKITKLNYGWILIDFTFFSFLIGFFIPFIFENLKIIKQLKLIWYKR